MIDKGTIEAIDNSKLIRNIGIGVGVLIGGIIIYYFAKKAIKDIKNKAKATEEAADLDKAILHLFKKQKPTHSKVEFQSMANALQEAFSGCGTDVDAVYAVFHKIYNDIDFLMLKKAFGVREWDGCNWAMEWGDTKGNIEFGLRSEMKDDKINYINKILSSRKIKYQF